MRWRRSSDYDRTGRRRFRSSNGRWNGSARGRGRSGRIRRPEGEGCRASGVFPHARLCVRPHCVAYRRGGVAAVSTSPAWLRRRFCRCHLRPRVLQGGGRARTTRRSRDSQRPTCPRWRNQSRRPRANTAGQSCALSTVKRNGGLVEVATLVAPTPHRQTAPCASDPRTKMLIA